MFRILRYIFSVFPFQLSQPLPRFLHLSDTRVGILSDDYISILHSQFGSQQHSSHIPLLWSAKL